VQSTEHVREGAVKPSQLASVSQTSGESPVEALLPCGGRPSPGSHLVGGRIASRPISKSRIELLPLPRIHRLLRYRLWEGARALNTSPVRVGSNAMSLLSVPAHGAAGQPV
jgi:hypothetical protein